MKSTSLFFIFVLVFFSCKEAQKDIKTEKEVEMTQYVSAESEQAFYDTMKKHMEAVSNKDLATLKSTMHPNGKMQLILPSEEITYTVEKFMDFHEAWFASGDWTFETEIIDFEVGPKFGYAIVDIIYREAERDGEPYFNKMVVSYDLENFEGAWYIIKDHASSVAKSTDTE